MSEVGWQGWALVALFVACRSAPLVLWAPFWGGRALPMSVRASVLVALATLVTPLVGHGLAADAGALWGTWAVLVIGLKECAIGAAVAVVASAIFWGVEMGGQLADTARGFPQATISAPAASGMTTPLGALGVWLTAAVFTAAGGHLLVIGALVRSFGSVPLLESPTWGASAREDLVLQVTALTAEVFALAALFALPVVASVWIAGMLMGVLHRAAPEVRAFFNSLSGRSLLGLLAALAVLHVVVDLAVDGAVGAVEALDTLWP